MTAELKAALESLFDKILAFVLDIIGKEVPALKDIIGE